MDFTFIIIPLLVLITSQALKLATDSIRGNFDIKNIWISYGGMPSSHTALMTSVTTLIGARAGIDTPLFALALIFTILTIRDAITFRNLLGQQGRAFNQMSSQLKLKNSQPFREVLGHTSLEVLAGALVGVGLTLIIYWSI